MRISFMNGGAAEPGRLGLPDIQEVLSDRVETWSGFPLTRARISHRPKPYLSERCKLATILQEIHTLILTKDEHQGRSEGDFERDVENLLARMHCWRVNLPKDLRYKWPMSSAVWELQYVHLSLLIRKCIARLTDFSAPPTMPLL